jgi:cysteine-rich repeat protein
LGPHCGDDVVQGAEVCDDGNEINADGCTVQCVVSGTLLWTHELAGGGDGAVNAVAVGDKAGEDAVYLVGADASEWVRRFDSEGVEVWVEGFPYAAPVSVGLDGEGNVYVIAIDGRATYDSNGNLAFQQAIDRDGYGIASSFDGNVVTVGTVSLHGIWARRFTTNNIAQWTDEPSNSGFDAAYAVAIDSAENVLVAGTSGVVPTLLDGWLRKYDSNGDEVWTELYNSGVSTTVDTFRAVAIGPDDAVGCVGGVGSVNSEDLWVGWYSADGDLEWSDTYSAMSGATRGVGVAIDGSGNLVVVATTPTVDAGENLGWVRKYSPEGVILWTEQVAVDDGDSSSTVIRGVAVSQSEEIYVVGSFNTGDDDDGWIGKMAP